ncbi:hypothetical protein [Mannheimia varigena]|uniref:hypothetical protein n=1 Tax=Mannheimia varigena TaxID=85404 RepID=UPI0015B3A217|nr:hypothetical protein [Mannheimia varigena]MDY2948150.1 hypothetical protein [Mannheimia varigena]QLD33208.1 hypothetical protein A6B42_05255 [Mannheimia varigena]
MNLNPFYHWGKYRSQEMAIKFISLKFDELSCENHRLKEQINHLETQNNTLLRRNEELVADKQDLLKQIDELHEQELKPIIVKHIHKHKKRGRKK